VITIIIPVWNRASLVGPAVASVLGQTHKDLEVIVVDDGSTDGSMEAARAAAGADSRVTFLAREHSGRPGVVKHAGIEAGTGEWVAVVDSDDEILPTALEEVLGAAALNPGCGVLFTNRLLITPKGEVAPPSLPPYSKNGMLAENLIRHLVVFRRDLYEKAGGFDPSFTYASNYDLALKLSEITEVHHLPRALYRYRVGWADSITVQFRKAQAAFANLARHNAYLRRDLPVPAFLSAAMKEAA
jgi:glycosyltransferase involved in cell wall biosynthesis